MAQITQPVGAQPAADIDHSLPAPHEITSPTPSSFEKIGEDEEALPSEVLPLLQAVQRKVFETQCLLNEVRAVWPAFNAEYP